MTSRTTRRIPRDAAPRVLVVYKKSAYQTLVRERRNTRIIELLERGDRAVERMVEAHEEHMGTLEEARAALDALGAKSTFRFRGDEGLVEDADMVVTIGGDGTLLWAARWVGAGLPMLAINSAPRDSVGHFCAGPKGRVREILEAALGGRLRESKLTRMRVDMDGETLTKRVLNDALFCHMSPAATSRYVLRVVKQESEECTLEEDQKSSGVWVGPSAGSTAAQLSAGGRVLPVGSRRLQFVVREAYVPPEGAYREIRGLIDATERLEIVSKIRAGRVFVDGPHHPRDVRMGATLVFQRSDEPLSLLGFPRAERESA